MSECDVLIVGAGPTGLITAAELSRQGITKIILIDNLIVPNRFSKASGLMPRTLEQLKNYKGVVPDIFKRCVTAKQMITFSGQKPIADISLAGYWDSEFDQVTLCEQWYTEKCISVYLQSNGVEIQRGWTLDSFIVTEDGVSAKLVYIDGSFRTVNAKYLVGADGSHSYIRKQLGIQFNGESLQNGFVCFHFEAESGDILLPDYSMVLSDQHGMGSISQMPEGSWILVLDLSATEEQEYLSDELDSRGLPIQLDLNDTQVRELIKRRVSSKIEVTKIIWTSHFRVNQRIAGKYWSQDRRIFIAGDSCHTHTPLGAQGLNLGIQDAVNLGWKLAFVLKNYSSSSILETFEQERRPVANSVVFLTGLMQKWYGSRNTFITIIRDLFSGPISSLPFVKRIIGTMLGQTGFIYKSKINRENWGFEWKKSIKLGSRVRPDLFYQSPDFLYSTTGFKLIIFPGNSTLSYEDVINSVVSDSNGVVSNGLIGNASLREYFKVGDDTESFFFIRPDGYICFKSKMLSSIHEYLGDPSIFIAENFSEGL
jgi:2-polyprenyl-6-methoxyphenol hydroxylase-like FAD-dependent oxidoreductase